MELLKDCVNVRFRADPGMLTKTLSSHIPKATGHGDTYLPGPDVVLVSEDGRTLPCHAAVLAAASPLLADVLRGISLEEEDARVVFSDVTHTELYWLLTYVYTGACNITTTNPVEYSRLFKDLRVRTSSEKIPKVKEEVSPESPEVMEDIISECDIYHDDRYSDVDDETNRAVGPIVNWYQIKPCAVSLENIGFDNYSHYSPPPSPDPMKRRKRRARLSESEDEDYFEDYKPLKKKYKKLKKKTSRIKKKYVKGGQYGENRRSHKKAYRLREGRENLTEEEIQKLLEEREENERHLLESLLVFPKEEIGLSKCYWCSHETHNMPDLQLHTKTDHPDKLNTFNKAFGYRIFGQLHCQFCGFNWKTLSELKRHIGMTHPEKSETFWALRNHDCLVCKNKFFNNFERMVHELRSHGITHKINGCQLCGVVSKKKGNGAKDFLFDHMLVHKTGNPRPYKCDVCGSAFSGGQYYRRHIEKHKIGETLCTDCGTTFKSDHDMERHKAWGTCISDLSLAPRRKYTPKGKVKIEPDGNFICENCGEYFTFSKSYKNHIRKCGMKEEDMLVCQHCDQKFHTKALLKKHMESHSVPSFQCPHCDKKFKSDAFLRRHMAANHLADSEKPFQCIDCGKGFMSERLLQDHTNVHTGAKPYQCRHCPTAFQNSSNRAAHEKKVHGVQSKNKRIYGNVSQALYANIAENMVSAEKPYQCRYCPLSYANSSNRNAHEKKRHAGPDTALSALSSISSLKVPELQKPVTDEDVAAIDYIIKERWVNDHQN